MPWFWSRSSRSVTVAPASARSMPLRIPWLEDSVARNPEMNAIVTSSSAKIPRYLPASWTSCRPRRLFRGLRITAPYHARSRALTGEGLVTSSTRRPSRRCRRLVAIRPIAALWVTTTVVHPCSWQTRSMRARISFEVS